MPDATQLAKAELRQLDANFDQEIAPETWCTVQFNPETMKVAFANELKQPSGAGDQRGSPARQFVGAGTTKLTLSLWFDVGSPQPAGAAAVDDVRKLTQKVAFYITPAAVKGKKDTYVPPSVRFLWGSFQFDGLMDSLEENLEYFSPEGKPLRASLAVSLSQQKIRPFAFRETGAAGSGKAGGASTPGTAPLAQAPDGATMQGVADGAGKGDDWQSIAAANGIENPRMLGAGAMLDLNLQAPQLGVEFGVAGGVAVAAPRASVGLSAGIGG
jgi:hypothetical protein